MKYKDFDAFLKNERKEPLLNRLLQFFSRVAMKVTKPKKQQARVRPTEYWNRVTTGTTSRSTTPCPKCGSYDCISDEEYQKVVKNIIVESIKVPPYNSVEIPVEVITKSCKAKRQVNQLKHMAERN